jgi:hypothetical protein
MAEWIRRVFRTQGLPYPKNNTFELTLARSILRTPLLDLDAGLRLEYPS